MTASCLVERGAVLAGRYRVERVLGRGGMGIVVQATRLQLNQPVAVKFLLPEMAGQQGARSPRRDLHDRVRLRARGSVNCVNNTFFAAGLPVAIPDNDPTGISSSIPVTGSGTVASLSLSITHDFPGEPGDPERAWGSRMVTIEFQGWPSERAVQQVT